MNHIKPKVGQIWSVKRPEWKRPRRRIITEVGHIYCLHRKCYYDYVWWKKNRQDGVLNGISVRILIKTGKLLAK